MDTQATGQEGVTLTAEDHCHYLAHHDVVPIDEEPGEYHVDPCSVFAPKLKTASGLPRPVVTEPLPEGESGPPDQHPGGEKEEA